MPERQHRTPESASVIAARQLAEDAQRRRRALEALRRRYRGRTPAAVPPPRTSEE